MQFFKYEGLALCETWSQENDSRRAMHEKIRKIALKSDSFNQKLQRKSYFFVTDASEDTIIIGVISKDSQHIQTWLEEYIKSVGMELKDTRLEEVTFNAIRNMLQRASQRDYIPDDDEVLEQFGLDKLGYRYGRGCRFDEGLIESSSKKEIYATADQLLSNETLIPELDRIYVRKAKSNAAGHPVHYIIQTILIYGKKWADFCFRRYMPETGCTAKGTVFWNLGREKNFHAQSITAFTKAVLEAR